LQVVERQVFESLAAEGFFQRRVIDREGVDQANSVGVVIGAEAMLRERIFGADDIRLDGFRATDQVVLEVDAT